LKPGSLFGRWVRMFARLSRGWALTKASLHVLRLDSEILVLPVLSGISMLLLAAVLLGPLAWGAVGGAEYADGIWMVAFLAVYFLATFVAIFFNTAVVHMATLRFQGQDPVVKDGLSMAASKWTLILQWAIVAATVGLVLRLLRNALRERAGLLGSLFGSLLEVAWGAIIYFVIPLVVYRGLGPIAAMKESWTLIKRTWGETVGGEVGMSLIFLGLGLVGLVVFLAGLWTGGVIGLALFGAAVLYWVLLVVVYTAAQGILTAALYRYATTGQVPQGFDRSMMANAVA
jgi:hypothetical protein